MVEPCGLQASVGKAWPGGTWPGGAGCLDITPRVPPGEHHKVYPLISAVLDFSTHLSVLGVAFNSTVTPNDIPRAQI